MIAGRFSGFPGFCASGEDSKRGRNGMKGDSRSDLVVNGESLKYWRAIVCGVLVSVLFSPALALEAAGTVKERITFRPAGVSVVAEKADSPLKRERGLMHRTRLGENDAMMFYFDETAHQTFWMYNTLIPLTVIFLDDGLKIVDMQEHVALSREEFSPVCRLCLAEPCPVCHRGEPGICGKIRHKDR